MAFAFASVLARVVIVVALGILMRAPFPRPSVVALYTDHVVLYLPCEMSCLSRIADRAQLPCILWCASLVDDVLCFILVEMDSAKGTVRVLERERGCLEDLRPRPPLTVEGGTA